MPGQKQVPITVVGWALISLVLACGGCLCMGLAFYQRFWCGDGGTGDNYALVAVACVISFDQVSNFVENQVKGD